jgi:UDP-N-acetylglucosamine 2-epimerase
LKINFIIGTKAQFIKTIPVINESIKRNLDVSIYDLKQHSKTTSELRKKINKEYKLIEVSRNKNDLGSYKNLITWFFKTMFSLLFSKEYNIKSEYCFVHGDTLSTLLGTILIKRNGGKLVLLEGGHAVPGIFKHFPESIVRYLVAKLSDIVIANGKSQIDQLSKWNVKAKVIEISTNTIYDSFSKVNLVSKKNTKEVIVSIHRTENINNKRKMELLVNSISQISSEYLVTWCLHIPTKNRLLSYKFYEKLLNLKVSLCDLLPYDDFINRIYNSEFTITDGGGVVEECQLLGTPTLVWRDEHLDQNHLFEKGNNLFLCNYKESDINYFFRNYKNFKKDIEIKDEESPSKQILDRILSL